MKHTPGPWDACIDGAIRTKGHPLMIRGRSCTIAEVIPQDNAEANARLIAAAPDLLEALCEIVRAELRTVDLQSMTPQHRQRLAKARAAIAKAEGGK